MRLPPFLPHLKGLRLAEVTTTDERSYVYRVSAHVGVCTSRTATPSALNKQLLQSDHTPSHEGLRRRVVIVAGKYGPGTV